MLGVGRVSVRVTFVDREGKEGAEGRGRGTKEEAETQEEGEEELFMVDEVWCVVCCVLCVVCCVLCGFIDTQQ
jgi:hypothetical protein